MVMVTLAFPLVRARVNNANNGSKTDKNDSVVVVEEDVKREQASKRAAESLQGEYLLSVLKDKDLGGDGYLPAPKAERFDANAPQGKMHVWMRDATVVYFKRMPEEAKALNMAINGARDGDDVWLSSCILRKPGYDGMDVDAVGLKVISPPSANGSRSKVNSKQDSAMSTENAPSSAPSSSSAATTTTTLHSAAAAATTKAS